MRDQDTIEWMQNLKKAGFEDYQIDYLEKAGELYRKGKVNSVDDIESELGYGVVDSGILRDTFDLRENVIEIKEDVKINDEIILEKGDKIEVLKEDVTDFWVDLWEDLKVDFENEKVNVFFFTKDQVINYGSGDDPVSYEFINFDERDLTLEEDNGKKLRINPSSSSKVTAYVGDTWGFKIESQNSVIYIVAK